MKPLAHSRIGAARHGGTWRDTIALHSWLDSSKATFASVQHRALLHHDLGAMLGQQIFGNVPIDGRMLPAQQLLADHVTEDLGSCVKVEDWLDEIPAQCLRKQRIAPNRRNVLSLREDPYEAAAARWGGKGQDYAGVIGLLDMPEIWTGHPRARALFHNSFGPFIADMLLGEAIEIEGGRRLVPTRTVAEDLILARMGWIPPASFVLSHIPMKPWMSGSESTPALVERKRTDQTDQRELVLA
jgi:hypothetical protein